MTEQTDAEFLRFMACHESIPDRQGARLRAIADRLEALDRQLPIVTTEDGPHSRACGMQKHEHGMACHSNCPTCGGRRPEPVPAPSLPALLTECPDCLWDCARCHGTGRVLTPAGEQVAELVDWVRA